jgi:hypothetical protein
MTPVGKPGFVVCILVPRSRQAIASAMVLAETITTLVPSTSLGIAQVTQAYGVKGELLVHWIEMANEK